MGWVVAQVPAEVTDCVSPALERVPNGPTSVVCLAVTCICGENSIEVVQRAVEVFEGFARNGPQVQGVGIARLQAKRRIAVFQCCPENPRVIAHGGTTVKGLGALRTIGHDPVEVLPS